MLRKTQWRELDIALPRKMRGHPYSVSATPICLPICQSFLFFSLSAAVAFPWSGFKRRMQDCYISIRQHGHLTTLCKLVSQAKGTGIYWQDTLCWIVRNDLKKKKPLYSYFSFEIQINMTFTLKHYVCISIHCLLRTTVLTLFDQRSIMEKQI